MSSARCSFWFAKDNLGLPRAAVATVVLCEWLARRRWVARFFRTLPGLRWHVLYLLSLQRRADVGIARHASRHGRKGALWLRSSGASVRLCPIEALALRRKASPRTSPASFSGVRPDGIDSGHCSVGPCLWRLHAHGRPRRRRGNRRRCWSILPLEVGIREKRGWTPRAGMAMPRRDSHAFFRDFRVCLTTKDLSSCGGDEPPETRSLGSDLEVVSCRRGGVIHDWDSEDDASRSMTAVRHASVGC